MALRQLVEAAFFYAFFCRFEPIQKPNNNEI